MSRDFIYTVIPHTTYGNVGKESYIWEFIEVFVVQYDIALDTITVGRKHEREGEMKNQKKGFIKL